MNLEKEENRAPGWFCHWNRKQAHWMQLADIETQFQNRRWPKLFVHTEPQAICFDRQWWTAREVLGWRIEKREHWTPKEQWDHWSMYQTQKFLSIHRCNKHCHKNTKCLYSTYSAWYHVFPGGMWRTSAKVPALATVTQSTATLLRIKSTNH